MLSSAERRHAEVVACRRCPELRAYCAGVAAAKRRAYREHEYWGKPVPGFGDPQAPLFLVGLAPGAHGSNRTGRMFTGDASGTWLYRALHRAGFASQPIALDRHDGMRLIDTYITAALRCAPPGNRPTPAQLLRCRPFLSSEVSEAANLRAVIALGAIGWKATYDVLRAGGAAIAPERPAFKHGGEYVAERPGRAPLTVIACYHVSRQNTNTGVLTEPMLDAVFARANALLGRTSGTMSGQ